MDRSYIAIDLKSFYASVECIDRRRDPLRTNLVVADPSRTEKTICLAVTPSLKSQGISGRPRLFEVVEKVREINARRLRKASQKGLLQKGQDGLYQFNSFSDDASVLESDETAGLSYIVAPPRMKLYEERSAEIVSIYLRFISADDLFVYSIDEVFIDATGYLESGRRSAREFALMLTKAVYRETGITATAGIGTNLYLAKVAMDIVAKHLAPGENGERIAELDEKSYRELLWCHRPLTDFWRVGRGYSTKLEAMGLHTMGEIARCSLSESGEDRLYKAFGINAELLIDHAWGWEPTTIDLVKSYRPESSSLSSGQVLKEPYPHDKALVIVKEMTELLALDLASKGLLTETLVLTINYDRESLIPAASEGGYLVTSTGKPFIGTVNSDYFGRPVPAHAHGTGRLPFYTDSAKRLVACASELFERISDPDLYVRRVTIAACDLKSEERVPEDEPEQLDLFTDYEALKKERDADRKEREKDRSLQRAMLHLQERYGKNAVLKGLNYREGATTKERNGQIGGHKAD